MLGKVKKNLVPLGDWAQGEEVSQVQAAQGGEPWPPAGGWGVEGSRVLTHDETWAFSGEPEVGGVVGRSGFWPISGASESQTWARTQSASGDNPLPFPPVTAVSLAPHTFPISAALPSPSSPKSPFPPDLESGQLDLELPLCCCLAAGLQASALTSL